jgi:hypothetical protein
MRNEFTAIVEQDGAWFISYCAEVLGANGQGKTRELDDAEAVPRHAEISNLLSRRICRNLSLPNPPG